MENYKKALTNYLNQNGITFNDFIILALYKPEALKGLLK